MGVATPLRTKRDLQGQLTEWQQHTRIVSCLTWQRSARYIWHGSTPRCREGCTCSRCVPQDKRRAILVPSRNCIRLIHPQWIPRSSDMPDFSEFSQHPAALPVTIIGLVGGPGSGKGTQCERLTKALPTIEHLSIGETLRQEMQSGSPYAQIIKQNMSAGMVGPPALTVGLLRRRMETSILERGISTFILDGKWRV